MCVPELLLRRRVARRIRRPGPSTGWRVGIVLHSRRRCARAEGGAAAALPVEIRRALLPESLQLRLVGCLDQEAPILRWIVNEYPILILVLMVELADRLVLAEAGNSHDRSTDDLARTQLIASGVAVPGS